MPAPISATLPAKVLPAVGVHAHLDRGADLDPADLRLLEVGGHPDPVQVVDRVDGLARLDDVALHHGLLGDGARDRGVDLRVEQLVLDDAQLGVRRCRPGRGRSRIGRSPRRGRWPRGRSAPSSSRPSRRGSAVLSASLCARSRLILASSTLRLREVQGGGSLGLLGAQVGLVEEDEDLALRRPCRPRPARSLAMRPRVFALTLTWSPSMAASSVLT